MSHRSPLSAKMLARPPRDIARLLGNPRLADRVIEQMNIETRRRLLVIAQTKEWSRGEVKEQLERADADSDSRIGAEEYEEWVRTAKAERHRDLSRKQLIKYGISIACPFIAFGCFDNSIMLLSGDIIDVFIGEPLGLSMMAAAAMGGIVSGVVGLQVHGAVERMVQGMIAKPAMSTLQRRHPTVLFTQRTGGTLGLAFGLCLGMFPLMWMERDI